MGLHTAAIVALRVAANLVLALVWLLALACAADLSLAQMMSPNYVRLPKCTAGSCRCVDGCSIHRYRSSVVSADIARYLGKSQNEVWRRRSGPCDHSFVKDASKQYLSNSLELDERLLPCRRETAEIIMGAWAICVLSVAAVVNQIAIALCRRGQAATEPDLQQEPSPEHNTGFDASPALNRRLRRSRVRD